MLPNLVNRQPKIPVHYTAVQIANDPNLSYYERARLLEILDNADASGSGLLTGRNIVSGAVGAGVGYLAARALGGVMSTVFGTLDNKTRNTLQGIGMVAGMLKNTGAI